MKTRLSYLAVLALVVSACSEPPMTPLPTLSGGQRMASVEGSKSYLVLGHGNSLPAGLSASVAAAGGTLTSSMDRIGIALVSSSSADFAAKAGSIKGVRSVLEDVLLQFDVPRVGGEDELDGTAGVGQNSVGDGESRRAIQWAPQAIQAPQAWDAGHQGAGARVAILDGAVYDSHIDIAPNFETATSASFVAGQAYNQDVGTFWHGTHVAGIVAAPVNGLGTVGIAPQATLIGVKVLHAGTGSFGSVIGGIYYAATPIAEGGAGAHIINMSLGALFPVNGRDAAELVAAMNRSTMYATSRGVLVVASAGNSAVNFDQTANWITVPGMSAGVVTVSALAPLGWALGATNYDRQASYTNFGQSAIDFGGPGGDSAYPGSENCTVGGLTRPCWVFDLVFAPCRGATASTSSYCWAAGTSMAAPAVAGVAALIKGANPGYSGAQIEAKLRASADDLGKPGNDDTYGSGRVNAYRAVQ
jgi:lantibiotic leader peptide-processing serine protease